MRTYYNRQMLSLDSEPLDLGRYPILFQGQSSSNTSRKYGHIATAKVLDVLMGEGWIPHTVEAKATRVEHRQGFQKHKVRLFHPSLYDESNIPQLVLSNSYDGGSAFNLALGMFRQVCSNGLLVSDKFLSESIRHVGYTDDKILQALENIIPQAERIVADVKRFQQIQLSNEQRNAFAESALEMRLNDDTWELDHSYSSSGVLRARRYGDNQNDLYTTMNVVQENMLRAGFHAKKKGTYGRSKVRAIKSMDESDKINRGLWKLTEKMAELVN